MLVLLTTIGGLTRCINCYQRVNLNDFKRHSVTLNNITWYMDFRLLQKSVTLNDLEGRNDSGCALSLRQLSFL